MITGAKKNVVCLALLLALAILSGCGVTRSYRKGVERYKAEDYDAALTEFRKVTAAGGERRYPDTPDWIVKCEMAMSKLRYETDIHSSLEYAEAALRDARSLGASQAVISQAEALLQGTKEERNLRVAKSKELGEQATDLLKRRNDAAAYTEAEGMLAEAARLDPRNPDAAALAKTVGETLELIRKADSLAKEADEILQLSGLTIKMIDEARKKYDLARDAWPSDERWRAGVKKADDRAKSVSAAADEFYKKALASVSRQDWPEATKNLKECLRLDYKHERAPGVLDDVARLENAQKEYNVILKEALELESAGLNSLPQARKAIALCDRALEIYPIGEKAQELLRQAKLRKTELDREFDVRSAAAEDEAKKKNYDGAIAALRACHAIDPADLKVSSQLVALLVEYGNILLGQKRPLEAETQFLEALSVEPDSAAAKEGMEKSQDAIKKLQMLAFARYEEALPLIEAGKLEEALAKLVEAVSNDPSNAKYTEKRDSVKATLVERYHRAAAEFESRHEWAKALAEYEKAVALDSRHIDDMGRMQREIEADSSVSSGDGLMQKGRFEEAAEQYKKALDLSARKEELLKKLDAALKPMTAEAEKLRGEGKYEEALARLDRVAAFNAKYDGVAADAESLRATLARAKERCEAAAKAKSEGRFVACRDALREVVEALPKYADAEKSLAEAEAKIAQAETFYGEALLAESGKDYDGAQVKYSASAAAALDFKDSATRAKELLAAKENYEKGEAFLAEKKLLAARDAYGAAAAIRKDFKEVRQRLSDIETKLAQVETLYTRGVAAQDKKDWDEAISKYEGLLGIIDDYNDTRARLEACKKAKGGS